jgi:hypothetical protein
MCLPIQETGLEIARPSRAALALASSSPVSFHHSARRTTSGATPPDPSPCTSHLLRHPSSTTWPLARSPFSGCAARPLATTRMFDHHARPNLPCNPSLAGARPCTGPLSAVTGVGVLNLCLDEPTIADDNWGLVLISIGLAANGMATPPTHPRTPSPRYLLAGVWVDRHSIASAAACAAKPILPATPSTCLDYPPLPLSNISLRDACFGLHRPQHEA